ncbi:hypothetical protein HMPREF9151_00251 [Hoylesella saccharolytica F0055]|uniref:Uncharacterized protein n=1 Tax=Hoylesella saccharolytica F0055 TaxID=1127699 RepID=L1NJA3_9BACT|nr:hypothetical protein HMPREF9151_00251 [Hoylesella saccharolytica F0055]
MQSERKFSALIQIQVWFLVIFDLQRPCSYSSKDEGLLPKSYALESSKLILTCETKIFR